MANGHVPVGVLCNTQYVHNMLAYMTHILDIDVHVWARYGSCFMHVNQYIIYVYIFVK